MVTVGTLSTPQRARWNSNDNNNNNRRESDRERGIEIDTIIYD
jgi:hypothetical protein